MQAEEEQQKADKAEKAATRRLTLLAANSTLLASNHSPAGHSRISALPLTSHDMSLWHVACMPLAAPLSPLTASHADNTSLQTSKRGMPLSAQPTTVVCKA